MQSKAKAVVLSEWLTIKDICKLENIYSMLAYLSEHFLLLTTYLWYEWSRRIVYCGRDWLCSFLSWWSISSQLSDALQLCGIMWLVLTSGMWGRWRVSPPIRWLKVWVSCPHSLPTWSEGWKALEDVRTIHRKRPGFLQEAKLQSIPDNLHWLWHAWETILFCVEPHFGLFD